MQGNKKEKINEFKSKLNKLSLPELKEELKKCVLKIISAHPNTWQRAVKSNNKHAAIIQLIEESKR